MKDQLILSPMARGSGAFVIHRLLERHLSNYSVVPYSSKWIFMPFMLPATASVNGASLLHTVADYARFFYRSPIPMIISFQNYVLDRWMRPYSSFLQRLHYITDLKLWTQLAINRAVKMTAVSRFTANLVKKDMKLSAQIDVIYNGVNTDHFTPHLHKIPNHKEVRVFFSGNLTRRKGAHWIPEIAGYLNKNINIYYTQGLRTRNTLPAMPNLKSIGSIQFKDMPNHYRQMDILLMPTVREGLSLSVMEAMACGIPIVASDCSSLPEQVDDGKGGFLCPVGDVKAFAEKINILADSPKIRNEMGEYNRFKVEQNFGLEKMINSYQNLFEKILIRS
jgi:glycosyltransferase involved in cell wall biosynthesis